MTEPLEAKKLSAQMLVPSWMVDDMHNNLLGPSLIQRLFAPDTRTLAQKAADKAARHAREAAERKAIEGRHAAALAVADPLLRPFLELHEPTFPGHGECKCDGCDFITNYEGESPDWPCRTYELAAGLEETG